MAKNFKPVNEAHLDEEDLIIVPGQGHRLKSGFIPHGKSRIDHEVEMAKSDLHQAYKNAKKVYELIKDVSEDEGLEGWVQEKIIKANDYLNSVREYLEHKQVQEMSVGIMEENLGSNDVVNTIIDAADRLFRKHNISDYNTLEAVKQGIRHHFTKPNATPETAIEGILQIVQNRMNKSGNYLELSKFKEALRQSIAHNLKKQSVQEMTGGVIAGGGVSEAQSMGTALKNTLAKAEPGSKLDNSIKAHNRDVKNGGKGTLKNAPTGYHFDSKGYIRLGDK